jgi:hypothetical protein
MKSSSVRFGAFRDGTSLYIETSYLQKTSLNRILIREEAISNGLSRTKAKILEFGFRATRAKTMQRVSEIMVVLAWVVVFAFLHYTGILPFGIIVPYLAKLGAICLGAVMLYIAIPKLARLLFVKIAVMKDKRREVSVLEVQEEQPAHAPVDSPAPESYRETLASQERKLRNVWNTLMQDMERLVYHFSRKHGQLREMRSVNLLCARNVHVIITLGQTSVRIRKGRDGFFYASLVSLDSDRPSMEEQFDTGIQLGRDPDTNRFMIGSMATSQTDPDVPCIPDAVDVEVLDSFSIKVSNYAGEAYWQLQFIPASRSSSPVSETVNPVGALMRTVSLPAERGDSNSNVMEEPQKEFGFRVVPREESSSPARPTEENRTITASTEAKKEIWKTKKR